MPNKELQELLGARFEGHTDTTNESIWSAIESQLDAGKSNRAGFWFWIFNGFAATLFVGLMVESVFPAQYSSDLSQDQTTKSTVKQEVITEQVQTNSDISKGAISVEKNIEKERNSEVEKGVISAETKIEKGGNYTEIRAPFVDEKFSNNKMDQFPNIRNFETKESKFLSESNVLKSTEIKQEITQQLPITDLFPTNTKSCPELLISGAPILLDQQKYSALKHLPIHLGLELTYLREPRSETDMLALDTGFLWMNNELEKNRHFEFSILSQFDLTKRFSTSLGFGYSSSTFVSDTSSTAASFSNTTPDPTKSNQQLFTIPVQAKFAFIQKNRFSLSLGLTFQGEFGRVKYSEPVIQTGITTGAPQNLSEASSIVTKKRIQQFALEPFIQFSIGISPRFSTFANLGYRSYFGQSITGSTLPIELNYLNADIGIQFRIH